MRNDARWLAARYVKERLGVAEVRVFGLTLEDCEQILAFAPGRLLKPRDEVMAKRQRKERPP